MSFISSSLGPVGIKSGKPRWVCSAKTISGPRRTQASSSAPANSRHSEQGSLPVASRASLSHCDSQYGSFKYADRKLITFMPFEMHLLHPQDDDMLFSVEDGVRSSGFLCGSSSTGWLPS
jgi:hypothetical protein